MASEDPTEIHHAPLPTDPPHPRKGKSQWFFRIDPSPEERERFLDQLRIFLAAMYPGCPRRWRRQLVEHARSRGHYGRLAEIAGVLASNSIRHRATDYERLLGINGGREGLTRDEARQVVKAEVEDMLAEWRQGSAEDDEGYVAVRRRFKKSWQKRGRKKPRPVLTANENAAIAGYLRDWLDRRPGEPLPHAAPGIGAVGGSISEAPPSPEPAGGSGCEAEMDGPLP